VMTGRRLPGIARARFDEATPQRGRRMNTWPTLLGIAMWIVARFPIRGAPTMENGS
jgi:hypothetical protein